MKIRMLTIGAGPDGNHDVGEIREVPDSEAVALIQSRQAEPVDKDHPEAATHEGGKTAVKAEHGPHAVPKGK